MKYSGFSLFPVLSLCVSSCEEVEDGATCSKHRVTEEDIVKDDLKKSKVEDSKVKKAEGQVERGELQSSSSKEAQTTVEGEEKGGESAVKEFILGNTLMLNSSLYFEI